MVWRLVVAEPTAANEVQPSGSPPVPGRSWRARASSDLMPAPWARPWSSSIQWGAMAWTRGRCWLVQSRAACCGEAAVGGALHGFGELEADEVAEALAVLEAEVSR